MKEELFDRKIKEMMDSAQVEPDAGLWENIQAGLDRRRTVVRFRRVVACISAVAAALVAGVFLFPVFNGGPSGSGDGLVAEIGVADDRAPETDGVQNDTDSIDSGEYEEIRVVPAPKEDLLAEARNMQNISSLVRMPKSAADVRTAVDFQDSRDGFGTVAEVGTEDAADSVEGRVESGSGDLNLNAAESGEVVSGKRTTNAVADRSDEEVMDFYEDSYYDRESELVRKTRDRRNGFSISANGLMIPADASGNVDFSGPSFSAGPVGGNAAMLGIKPISIPKHSFPVTVGVDVAYNFLKGRLGIGLGVNYTFLQSRYDALINNAEQGVVQQELHYVGVPLKFYVNIISYKGLNLYADLGGTLEKGVKAVYNITNLENNRYTKESKINGVQWSANVGIGLEYRFLDFLGIYLDPHLTYYFDCGQPYSVRTEQPLQFGLELGFRFTI